MSENEVTEKKVEFEDSLSIVTLHQWNNGSVWDGNSDHDTNHTLNHNTLFKSRPTIDPIWTSPTGTG